MPLREWISTRCFHWVHEHSLVYNTCWEDPRLDRQALPWGPTTPGHDHFGRMQRARLRSGRPHSGSYCIDVNPRQNALLELKLAGIRQLEYPEFFALFSRGFWTERPRVYHQQAAAGPVALGPAVLGSQHSLLLRQGARRSFYFRGTSGWLAFLMNSYIDHVAKVRDAIEDLLAAASVEEQQAIYSDQLHDAFWNAHDALGHGQRFNARPARRAPPQRQQVDRTYPGGIARFIEDRLEAVFTRIPLQDNYFWRVYLTGQYTPECCPEYLKEDNFHRLKAGLADRIRPSPARCWISFRRYPGQISRFVLLDHMDWLSTRPHMLAQQWQALLDRAAPRRASSGAAAPSRSTSSTRSEVEFQGQRNGCLATCSSTITTWRTSLHVQDRVHTYGSFYIADLMAVFIPFACASACVPHTSLQAKGMGFRELEGCAMSLAQDLKILYHVAFAPVRGKTHEERLESFYCRPGRRLRRISQTAAPRPRGTLPRIAVPARRRLGRNGRRHGSNLEYLGPALRTLQPGPHCRSVAVASRDRPRNVIARLGWTNVVRLPTTT